MGKKEQAKDFEKVEGAQLSDEEQEQVQGSQMWISKITADADMAMKREQAVVKKAAGLEALE